MKWSYQSKDTVCQRVSCRETEYFLLPCRGGLTLHEATFLVIIWAYFNFTLYLEDKKHCRIYYWSIHNQTPADVLLYTWFWVSIYGRSFVDNKCRHVFSLFSLPNFSVKETQLNLGLKNANINRRNKLQLRFIYINISHWGKISILKQKK